MPTVRKPNQYYIGDFLQQFKGIKIYRKKGDDFTNDGWFVHWNHVYNRVGIAPFFDWNGQIHWKKTKSAYDKRKGKYMVVYFPVEYVDQIIEAIKQVAIKQDDIPEDKDVEYGDDIKELL